MSAAAALLPVLAPAPIGNDPADWFTLAQLAELALPGLPADKRSLARRARHERWHLRCARDGTLLSRPRAGKGGGTEFHVSLLPGSARLELAARSLAPAADAQGESPAAARWRWFEAQKAPVKAEGERRLAIVQEVVLLESAGLTRTAAIAEAARRSGTGSSTLWAWLRLVEGVARADWLPALAPERRGGGKTAAIPAILWEIYKGAALRDAEPTLTSCYRLVAEKAQEQGVALPAESAFRRRYKREVDPRVALLRRKGEEALRRSLPSQRRTVKDLHALKCVNLDGHKWDVFVMPPDAQPGDKPVRPVMIALQDVYSRKVLAWRIGLTENAVQTRLVFADLFEGYGIPEELVMDNGSAFNSKWLTGGMPTRFRHTIRADDPTGMLVALGITIHPTLPYRGQSKPIERCFRDMCADIAIHPATDGAYTGNSTTNKPESYGKRAMEWDAFVSHVNDRIAAHNARMGRTTEMARGRKTSFDQVFAESYAVAPIGKASPEQMRMALLTAERKTVDRRTAEIVLYGNRYWSEHCGRLHGQKVTVRFDPDDLTRDIYLYAQDGSFLCAAQMIADTGFMDAAGAKAAAKRWKDYRALVRAAVQTEQLLEAAQVARLLASSASADVPEPSVVRPVRPVIRNGQSAARRKPEPMAVPEPSKSESTIFRALRLVSGEE